MPRSTECKRAVITAAEDVVTHPTRMILPQMEDFFLEEGNELPWLRKFLCEREVTCNWVSSTRP